MSLQRAAELANYRPKFTPPVIVRIARSKIVGIPMPLRIDLLRRDKRFDKRIAQQAALMGVVSKAPRLERRQVKLRDGVRRKGAAKLVVATEAKDTCARAGHDEFRTGVGNCLPDIGEPTDCAGELSAVSPNA